MNYVVVAIAVVYALLCLYAAVNQLRRERRPKRRRSAWLMLAGAVVLIAAAVLELRGWDLAWLVMLIGGLLTCQAALINGRYSGRNKLQNHAVRFLIVIFFILGSALW